MRKRKKDHFYRYVRENIDGQSFELSGKLSIQSTAKSFGASV
jgi:hypothetical protein